MHVGLTLAGGAIFAPCIGLISKLMLSRQDLVKYGFQQRISVCCRDSLLF